MKFKKKTHTMEQKLEAKPEENKKLVVRNSVVRNSVKFCLSLSPEPDLGGMLAIRKVERLLCDENEVLR